MEIINLHNKDIRKRLLEQAIDFICIICLTSMILFLCNMQNELYGTLKDIWYVRAVLMLTIFMFIKQKVHLLNWQSAAATLLYLPFAYFYGTRYSMAPDLYNKDKVVVWIIWITILILLDMIIYKKVNLLNQFNFVLLSIYIFMILSILFINRSTSIPSLLVLMLLFYLIPFSKSDWIKITTQFCNAWLLAFFVILYRSLKENPALDTNEGIGRWYGCFVNIGAFGLFMACVVVAVLYMLYQSKKEKGRKSFSYIFYFVCLIPILWTVFRVSTITMFIGIGFVFIMGFIIIMKHCTAKKVVTRLVISFFSLMLFAILGCVALKALANTDAAYWETVLSSENILLKPIASIIRRAHYMFDEPKTFADSGIFEPNSLINYLDLFSSGRLSLIKTFSEYFNFTGNSVNGIQVGTYFAYHTHNTYSQLIFNYGYISGCAIIIWLIYSTIASVIQYIKKQDIFRIFTCIWLAMNLGVLLGESVGLASYPLIMTLFLLYPIMINFKDKPENIS